MGKIAKRLLENSLIPFLILFVLMAIVVVIPKMESDPTKKKYWLVYRGTVVIYILNLIVTLHTSVCKLRIITGDYTYGVYYCITIVFISLLFLLGVVLSHSSKLAFRQQPVRPSENKSLFPGYGRAIRGLFLTKYYWAFWVTILLSIGLYFFGREI